MLEAALDGSMQMRFHTLGIIVFLSSRETHFLKERVNRLLELLVNILFGFLCTPIFAFLLEWRGVWRNYSLTALFEVFSILMGYANKASALHDPMQSGCHPYSLFS